MKLRTELRKSGTGGNAIKTAEAAVAVSRRDYGDVSDRLAIDLGWLGSFYVEVDDLDAARRVLQEAFAIRSKLHGEKDYQTADVRRDLADVDLRARLTPAERRELIDADHDSLAAADRSIPAADAVKAATRSIEIRKRLLGPEHPLVARSLRWQGLAYQRLGKLDRAEASLQESVTIRTKVLGDNLDTAGSLESLALVKEQRGDIPAAIALCRQELAMRQRLFGDESVRTAESWHNLARMAARRPTFADAEVACRRALSIRERMLGADHLQTASTLGLLGEIEMGLSHYGQGETLLKRALKIRQKRLGNDHYLTLENQLTLARLYERRGQYPRSAEVYQRVLETRRRLLGEENALTGDAYSGLGFEYMLMGEYAKARPPMTRAVEILTKTRGEDHSYTGTARLNLGRLYVRLGDVVKAEPVFQKTLAIEQRVRPGDFQAARAMDGLVDCCFAHKDFARAEQLCRDSLAIKRRIVGDHHPDVHVTLHSLGEVYRAEGRYAEARDTYEKTLKFARESLGNDHVFVANLLCDLGYIAQDMNDDASATKWFTEELAVAKKLYHGDHPFIARALYDMGENEYCRGASQQAVSQLNDALEMCQNVMRQKFGVMSEREQLVLQRELRHYLDLYLTVTGEVGTRPADAYRHLLSAKGAVTADQWLSRLERGRPELHPLTDQLRDVGARLAQRSFATPEKSRREAWLKEISDLTEQKERLEQELANKSSAFREHKQGVHLDPNTLRATLPKDAALVDILLYSHSFPRQGGEKKRRAAELHAVAFVLKHDAEIRRIELGPFEPIFQSMNLWRETYGATSGSADPGRDLRERIWKPLEPYLSGATTVFVSPDGSFCLFPLAALPGSKPDTYLIEERNIVLVPVPQLLLQQRAARVESEVAPQPGFDTPLLVGNVDFDADPRTLPATATAARGDMAKGLFSPLPESGNEIVEVAEIYRRTFQREPLVLTGKQASEQSVRSEAERHRWLHFATHGFFASNTGASNTGASNTVASNTPPAGKQPKPAGKRAHEERANGNLIASVEDVRGFHPSLLSGIVLAGANRGWATHEHRTTSETDDGVLSALEVEQLNLADTELVVLSACETGLGRLAGGEGTLGLQRAFQIAGARNVVASLWKVDDRATAALMRRFYLKLWTEKKSPAVALREAQLALLHHPEQAESFTTRSPNFNKSADLPDKGTVQRPNATTSPRLWAAFVIAGPALIGEAN